MSHSGWSTSNWISALGGTIPQTFPFTYHARFKPSSVAGISSTLLAIDGGSTVNEYLIRISSGALNVRTTAAGAGSNATGPSSLSVGTWYSVVGVFSSTTLRKAYLDGVVGTDDTSSKNPGSLSTRRIGLRSGSADAVRGSLAEVAIWNVALSAEDIAALVYTSPLLIRPDALVCYIPLLDSGTLDLVAPAATVTGTLTKDNDHPRVILPRQRSLIIPKGAGGGTVNYAATLDPATLAYTGSSLTAVTGRNAVLDPSSFALTGQDLAAVTGRNAVLSPASFLYTGQDLEAVYVDNGVTVDYTAELSPASFSFTGASLDIAASITSTQIGPADDRPARRKRRDRETLEAYYAALQRKANEDAEREKLEALAEAERALEEAETAKKAEAKRAAVRKVFAALDRAALTEKAKAGAREAEQAALQAIAKRQTDEQREAYLDALDQLNVEIEMIGAQIARLYARRREEERFLLQRWFAA